MNNMKYMSLMLALACFFLFGFTSCSSDDDDNNTPAPTITMSEANIEGDIICVKANVNAPGRTNTIDITVTSYSLNISAQYSCTANIISFTASATFTLTSMGALNLQATLISMN